MSTAVQPPKPKRRWYQFSLLTLLVVVTVACVAFAWIGYRMDRARKNRQRMAAVDMAVHKAVRPVQELGAFAVYEYRSQRSVTWLEELFDDPGCSDDPNTVLWVRVVCFNVTDAGLKYLEGLTNLEYLDLTNTNITDAGLEHLKGLTHLKHLDLTNTNITDAGLEHLKGLTHLEHLDLVNTMVSNEDVKKLQGALPSCRIHHH